MVHANEAHMIANKIAEENERKRELAVRTWIGVTGVEDNILDEARKGTFKMRIDVSQCPYPIIFRTIMEQNGYQVQCVSEYCGIPKAYSIKW